MPAPTLQPVIYLCNGFGHDNGQPRYKSIAAFYTSFDKDYLNTAEVEGRTEQKPYIEADVKANGLQKWEGLSIDVDFSVGQRTHRFRFAISQDQKSENGRVGSASEIKHDGTYIGETLPIYRADNGGQIHPLQALWSRKGWYFLRVYYCTAAEPRKVPFKLKQSIQVNQGPLIPASNFMMLEAAPEPEPELLVSAEQENGVAQDDGAPKDGLDPDGNKLPTDADSPPEDRDQTEDWPEEQPDTAKDDKWKDDPAPLVEDDGTLDLGETNANGLRAK